MTKIADTKTVPKLENERDCFSIPAPQTFEFGEYSYTIKPFDIIQRRKWSKIVSHRESLMSKYWADKELGNIYSKMRGIFTFDCDGELDKDKQDAMRDEAFEALGDDKKGEYWTLLAHLTDSRFYAFENLDYNPLFSIICSHVTTDRDGESKGLTEGYLKYKVSWEELCFICEKIDEANTLTDFEVLGLR